MASSPPDFRTQGCAGSIISDKHILTSASCASGDSTIYVHLGDTILGNDKDVTFNRTVLVTKKTLHPDYDFSENNNIAILEMAEPMQISSQCVYLTREQTFQDSGQILQKQLQLYQDGGIMRDTEISTLGCMKYK